MIEDRDKQEHLKKLILLAKSGDDKAFDEVYGEYYTPIFRYIITRIKDRDEALDMTQIVFMKIWQYIPKWTDEHTSPLAFFFTVARNTLIDYFRKNSHRDIVSDEIVHIFSETHGTLDRENKDYELNQIMIQAIEKLSKEQQEIITLFYTHDLTYKEIATILSKKEDAIRQIHSRAIKKLRDIYEY